MILDPINSDWHGVAIVLHGLNLKPKRMLPLAKELRKIGIGVCNGALQGHGDNYRAIAGLSAVDARLATYRAVTLPKWLGDLDVLYTRATYEAQQRNVPLFLVGFSMGALVACTAMATCATVRFERMVLFAPALAIHPHAHLPRLFKRWPHLLVRSFAPPRYRANRATPVAAYLAVRAAQVQFRQCVNPTLNVPTQIFIGPRDELISRRGLRQIIAQHHLTQWQIDVVSKREAEQGAAFHHLIIDPASVGQREWARMMKKIETHLFGDEPTN